MISHSQVSERTILRSGKLKLEPSTWALKPRLEYLWEGREPEVKDAVDAASPQTPESVPPVSYSDTSSARKLSADERGQHG